MNLLNGYRACPCVCLYGNVPQGENRYNHKFRIGHRFNDEIDVNGVLSPLLKAGLFPVPQLMQRCNRHAFTLIKKYAAITPASQRAIKAATLVVEIGCGVGLRFATVAAGASPEYAFIVGVYVGLVCLFFTGELAVLFLSGALTPAWSSPGSDEAQVAWEA